MSEGKLTDAEREARLALNDSETSAVAWAILGTIRLKQKKFDESVRFLQKSLLLNPSLIGARLTLGQAFLIQGETGQARHVLEQALQIDPRSSDARFSLAQLEAESGNYKTSLAVAEPIFRILYSNPSGIHLLATDYLGLGKTNEARGLIPRWKSLAAVPATFSISFASLLLRHDLAKQAAEVLECAKNSGPASFELISRLAESYWAAGDLDRAQQNYQDALRLNRNCVICCLRIAKAVELRGDSEKALSYLIRAKRLQPENAEVMFEFGKICLERDLFRDALPALEKAVQLKPDNDRYIYVLASAYVGKQRSKDALILFDRLLSRNPEDPVLNYAMGAVLYMDGSDLARAEKYLKKSIALQPVQMAAYYYLGMLELAKGDQNQAAQLFREVLRQQPDHVATLEQLSAILLKERRYSEAQELLQKVLRLDGASQMGHYQYSLLLSRLGRKEESAEQMEIAKRLEGGRRKKMRTDLYLLDAQ